MNEPSRRDTADVAAELGTNVDLGLTSADAAGRLEREGPNELEAAERVPGWRRFLDQFADPLIYLLIAAIAISLVAWVIEGRDGFPTTPS